MDTKTRTVLEKLYQKHFGALPSEFVVAQAPGRLELAGNHTDHQGGKVLAAATKLCTHALAATTGEPVLQVWMEGYGKATIDISATDWMHAKAEETNSSAALIRGMAAQFVEAGGTLSGLNMVVRSDIPMGAGLSSSAAFEMALGVALQKLFAHDNIWRDSTELAMAGVAAERNYFGKPCGAQDQLTSATGGIVFLDCKSNPPQVEQVSFDPASSGLVFCIIDSLEDHSKYTAHFAKILEDMYAISHEFKAERLIDVNPNAVLKELPRLRLSHGDKACMRALHFFDENKRVAQQRTALEANDTEAFLSLVRLSGASSMGYLQNVSPDTDNAHQPAAIILALCSHLLGNNGAWRIHGGGFGGSVLAVLPKDASEAFVAAINGSLGTKVCTIVDIGGPGAHAERVSA